MNGLCRSLGNCIAKEMKKLIVLAAAVLLIGGLAFGQGKVREVATKIVEYFYDDPDMPSQFDIGLTKEEYLSKRSEQIEMKRGIERDRPFDPQLRVNAIRQLDTQQEMLARRPESREKDSILAAWTPIGPNPIPNGQTQTVSTAVSGRTTAIAVHPADPNIVYVGTAQGGLYRSLNGGVTWAPMMDNALSLSIGAVAIAPSQPDTIYVGTGEPNLSADSFFGVGVYRIDGASTGAPTLTGPLNRDAANIDIFTGRGIGRIIVHPTDPATIFVATTSGVGGIVNVANNVLPNRGIYRSTNATSASPTFAQIGVLPSPNNNFSVRDIAIDPSNPNIMVANLVAGGGGIYRSTNALAASPTFANVFPFPSGSGGTSNLTAEFAVIHPSADPNATFYAAVGNNAAGTGTGRLLKSVDGGATFVQVNATTFCSGQCFYDIAVEVDPTNVSNVYLGGSPTLIFGRSIDGGTTFTANAATANGLHGDSHTIAVAPSLPSTIYFGCDGGIYKSTDNGTTWTSLNNSTFSATQFMSLAVHPTDANFTIGGTQDNGTNFYQPGGTWTRADFGDGGNTVIDQNAPDTTNVRMYHTYFNQTNAMGYARVLTTANAMDNLWSLFGCGFGGSIPNGMTCTASATLFYAPMEQGPGNPNTLYFGSDVLYRSADGGTTMAKVSQEPITSAVPISAIGISPQDDNVRVIGQTNGAIFGTTTGANPLVNLDPANAVPNNAINRVVIDPTNSNTAYVTLSAFGVANVWKTTNLNASPPTWTSLPGTGANLLPLVPVNGFVVDPLIPNGLYAGTDIGVYASLNGGLSWAPFGTGLPRVAVFDMAITPGRLIRIATHGRGMWQLAMFAPTAADVAVAGRVSTSSGRGIRGARVVLSDGNGNVKTALTSGFGFYRIENVEAGKTYFVNVESRRYTFESRVITPGDELTDVNFVASP